jgi:hypothetical protein
VRQGCDEKTGSGRHEEGDKHDRECRRGGFEEVQGLCFFDHESVAKRFLLEDAMNRQALHRTDFFLTDILRIVKDFKCDAVTMPAHIGHRDINSGCE